MLVAAAVRSGVMLSPPAHRRSRPPVSLPAQLFSGALNSRSTSSVNSFSTGKIVGITTDRFAFSLPDYGQGNPLQVSPQVLRIIVNALGGEPAVRSSRYFTAKVTGGDLQQSQYVSQATPLLSRIQEIQLSLNG